VRRRAVHRWTKHEIAWHTATLNTLADARDQVDEASIEWIFLRHAFYHCLEQWLSEREGRELRITWADEHGVEVSEVKRCG
jgi:hypothetical protein